MHGNQSSIFKKNSFRQLPDYMIVRLLSWDCTHTIVPNANKPHLLPVFCTGSLREHSTIPCINSTFHRFCVKSNFTYPPAQCEARSAKLRSRRSLFLVLAGVVLCISDPSCCFQCHLIRFLCWNTNIWLCCKSWFWNEKILVTFRTLPKGGAIG